MKNLKILIGTLLLAAGAAGCTSAYYATGSAAYDDLYGTHNKADIARKQRTQAEQRKAAAEARQAEWEARLAEAQAQAAEDAYYDNPANIVADSYESAYARRLRGFDSPTYRMPSSYYELRYDNSAAFTFATAYDPAFYNIMISGDQVWVEPKYITSMFGTWGAVPYGGWYFGWNWGPSSVWWGYPRYSWWGWNWSISYNPWYDPWYYNPWWGYYPPHYHPGGGGGHHRPHTPPNIVHRPSFTAPSAGRGSGSGTVNRGSSSSFGVRGTSGGRTYGTGPGSGASFNRGTGSNTRNSSGVRQNRGGTTTFNRGSSSGSSTFNRGSSNSSSSFNRGSSTNSSSSFNRGTTTTTPSPSFNRGGSSSGSYGSGSSPAGRGVSGRNAGGR